MFIPTDCWSEQLRLSTVSYQPYFCISPQVLMLEPLGWIHGDKKVTRKNEDFAIQNTNKHNNHHYEKMMRNVKIIHVPEKQAHSILAY